MMETLPDEAGTIVASVEWGCAEAGAPPLLAGAWTLSVGTRAWRCSVAGYWSSDHVAPGAEKSSWNTGGDARLWSYESRLKALIMQYAARLRRERNALGAVDT